MLEPDNRKDPWWPDVLKGFLIWCLLNGLLFAVWVIFVQQSWFAWLALAGNLAALYCFANRPRVALGMLIAFAVLLLVPLILGVFFFALCTLPAILS